MRSANQLDSRRGPGHWQWSLGIGIALCSAGCAMGGGDVEKASQAAPITLAAAPTVTITAVRPIVAGAIVYEPLAGRNALHYGSAQLSIDIEVRNDQASAIDVDRMRLSYAGPAAPFPVSIESLLRKLCPGEDESVPVPNDREIAPGEACKLMLNVKLPEDGTDEVTIEVFFDGYADPVEMTYPLVEYQNDVFGGSYRFPARAEDLPAEHFWAGSSTGAGSHHRDSTSEMFAYDLGVVRWDSAWTSLRSGTTGDTNDDFLCWDEPVYAMADGVVVAFEALQPDNPEPDKKAGTGANFVTIDHGGETARYFHFKYDTVAAAVRSVGATVTAGQLLGRCGNSGDSTRPHLHVDITKTGGSVGMPLLFQEIFLVDRTTLGTPPDFDAPFTAVNDQGLNWEKNVIVASPFLRKGQETDVAIDEVAITSLTSTRAVTAASTAAGNLQLVSWEVDGDGHIDRQDDDGGGAATEVAIARTSFGDVVTAFRNGDGDLELISWNVTGAGVISRLDEATTVAASEVAMASLPSGSGVVTAIRNDDGDLRLTAWEVAGDGTITRRGSLIAEAITDVAIATFTSPFEGVVTAAHLATGQLMVTTWELTAELGFIRRDDAFGVQVTEVALAPVKIEFGNERIVTAVRTSGGNLRLDAWQVSAGGLITAQGSATGGAIDEVAVAAHGQYHALTAVSDDDGDLKLIAWELSNAGEFEREGEHRGGEATSIALPGVLQVDGKKLALPVMRDSGEDLRVIAVQTNLTL
jgi:hypothetical protein